MKIDFQKVFPLNEMKGDDAEDTALLNKMYEDAKNYLTSHNWCESILDSFWGIGIGGILAVFLFKIKGVNKYIDDYIWVITGDIPYLYVSTEETPNPACALDAYIGVMEKWAEAAISGSSTLNLPPINVKKNRKNGLSLKKRLEFIDKNLLSFYEDELSNGSVI